MTDQGPSRVRRPLVRYASIALLLGGIFLLAEAVLTITWQEPISAAISDRGQRRLDREVRGQSAAAAADARELAGTGSAKERARELAARFRRRLPAMGAFGRLTLPTLGRSYIVSHDEDVQAALETGPAHYPDTPLPGEGATVGIAGHRTTYGAPFRMLHKLRGGDPVVLEMPYGRFEYRVERVVTVLPTEVWVKRPIGRERLLLSASHPPYGATHRLVAFARLTRVELVDSVAPKKLNRR